MEMFRLSFEHCYHGTVTPQEPLDKVRRGAESQMQYLLPGREHLLYTTFGVAFLRGTLPSSEGWRITYTPVA